MAKHSHQNNSHQNNALIKELNAEARKNKLINLLNNHKKLIVCLALTITLALILWLIFCWYSKNQSEHYSAILHKATQEAETGDTTQAKADLKQIYESTSVPAGVKEIASLRYASLLKPTDMNQTVAVYLQISKNSKFDNYVREYAGLMALKILVSVDKKDNQDTIKQLIADLAKSKVLKYYIMEQEGIFDWNNGNFKEADAIFKNIAKNPEASEMLKKRVQEMHSAYLSKFGISESEDGKKDASADKSKNKKNDSESDDEQK